MVNGTAAAPETYLSTLTLCRQWRWKCRSTGM